MSQTSLVKTANNLAGESYGNGVNVQQFPHVPERVRVVLQYLLHVNRHSNQQGFVESQQSQKDKVQPVQSYYLAFCNSFKNLSRQQQNKFLSLMMEELKNRNLASSLAKSYDLNQQEYACQMRTISCCLKQWNNIILRLNKKRKTLRVIYQGKSIDLYLREYLLRRSKVHALCFVLQNVGFAAKDMEYCCHFKFSENDKEKYEYVVEQIVRLIVRCQVEDIIDKIKEEEKMKEGLSKSRGMVKLVLTRKNIGKLAVLAGQKKLRSDGKENITENETDLLDYQEINVTEGVVILVNRMDNTSYMARYTISHDLQQILANFLDSYKQSHSMIIGLRILQSLKESQPNFKHYSAFYQKLVWNDKIYGQTLICLQEGSTVSDGFTFLIDNIDHSDNHNFIQHLRVFTATPSHGKVEIRIQAKFTTEIARQSGAMDQYLLKFQDVFEGKHLQLQQTPSVFYMKMTEYFNEKASTLQKQQQTIKPLSQQTTHLQLIKRDHNKDIDNLFSDNFKAKQGEIQIQRVVVSNDYLKTRHVMQPSNEKTGRIMKDHFIWNYWKRAQKGGLVCKDQELVDKQKKMFKLVLKKFGETLLKGKSIMNFSLPVIVFKKESHLESLAKSYLYSPIFTEKAAATSNPLQRMKYSVVLMITQNALSIHMQKPFNPILGETFQGYINGCPIYLEQISHHPPISAYFLQGRGYKKYGCMQPKISVGLNSGSGYSIFPHFVEFNDGMKIEYVCAKMLIGGLLIGERTFNFQDKIYSYDRTNKLFSSVSFGPKKRNFFGSNSQPQDYFHGFIYEVTPSFQACFDSEKGIKPHPQSQHIVRQLATFDGIWNSFININGEEILNFKTDLPYEFQQEKRPLPSDSRYREDLSNLLAGDLEASQAAKEEMEENQRRDQRLREGQKD